MRSSEWRVLRECHHPCLPAGCLKKTIAKLLFSGGPLLGRRELLIWLCFVDFFLISDDEVFKLFDHVGDVEALEYLLRVFFEDFLLLCVVSEVMYGFADGGYIARRNEYAGFAIHENFFGAGGCGCGNDRAV